MTSLKDLEITYDKPNWCPGCGDFGIWAALKNAIIELGLNPFEVVLVSGIGCSSKMPYWVKTYGFNGLHGRAIPVAEGIKLSNHKLTVIVTTGDGDQYGEGLNHLIHAARRNINIKVMVFNNQIYGLTTGQYSPTTDLSEENKVSPTPIVEEPLNPLLLSIASGATFVARSFAGDLKGQAEIIKAAINHKGFSLIDVMQPCVTFNKKHSFQWFKERIYQLDSAYSSKDKQQVILKAQEWPLTKPLAEGEKEKIPTGIFYQEQKPTWEDCIPQIKKEVLIKQNIQNININSLIHDLT